MPSKTEISDVAQTLSIEALKARIEADIAQLRTIADDPVDIAYGENISFEVRHISDSERLNVYRKGWGGTTVNYTHEGLILDVYAEESITSHHTVAIEAADLELEIDDDQEVGASSEKV